MVAYGGRGGGDALAKVGIVTALVGNSGQQLAWRTLTVGLMNEQKAGMK